MPSYNCHSPRLFAGTATFLSWYKLISSIVYNSGSTIHINSFIPNKPFPSSPVPLFQSKSKWETILMKMTLICMKMNLLAELIFMWKISHLDLFWNRRTRELGDGLLLDDIFVIARVIKVSAGVISWSPRLRLITLIETLIILDITKTKSNNCFLIHWTKKKWNSCFCFFTDGKL